MEITIGKRSAYFCNLKVLLILLVVYGHLIESKISDSAFFMWQYRIIYSVHIPLFAFVSGVFLKEKRVCFAQFKKALLYYTFFQLLSMTVIKIVQGTVAPFTIPYWHLWYLLSLSCWALLCLALETTEKYLQGYRKKAILIIISIGIACIVGNIEGINRTFSLSRTIAFLPYVLMGKYLGAEIERRTFRIWGILAGVLAIGVLVGLESAMPIALLYQADSYMAIGVENGAILRLLSYVIGVGMGLFILAFTPQKRLAVSKIGVNTLWIYILHAPVVLFIQKAELLENEFPYIAWFVAMIIILLIYKGFQWREKLYRIV